MKSIQEHIKNNEDALKELIKHPRFKHIDFIYQRVNTDRVRDGYKPLSKKILAIKISHLSMDDIDFLVKRMSQSSSPGKVFFGSLKIKK